MSFSGQPVYATQSLNQQQAQGLSPRGQYVQQAGTPPRMVQVVAPPQQFSGQPVSPGSVNSLRRVSGGSSNSVTSTGSYQGRQGGHFQVSPPQVSPPTGSYQQPGRAAQPGLGTYRTLDNHQMAAAQLGLRTAQADASPKTLKDRATKRGREFGARVSHARRSMVLYVYYLGGCAKSVVGEAIHQIKTEGVKAWAVDTARATPIKARAAAAFAKKKASQFAAAAHEVAKDKCFQVTAASATGGAVTLGATGGFLGLATGVVGGAIVGLPLALFTFGLSIPISATIGGTCGLVTGAAAGGATGAVTGGGIGYGAYQNRKSIASAVSSGRQQVSSAANKLKSSVRSTVFSLQERVGLRSRSVAGRK